MPGCAQGVVLAQLSVLVVSFIAAFGGNVFSVHVEMTSTASASAREEVGRSAPADPAPSKAWNEASEREVT